MNWVEYKKIHPEITPCSICATSPTVEKACCSCKYVYHCTHCTGCLADKNSHWELND